MKRSYIYVFRLPPAGTRQRVKIGISNDPEARRRSLAITGAVEFVCAIPGTTIDEQGLHQRFAAYRADAEEVFWEEGDVGEWLTWLSVQPGVARTTAGLRHSYAPHGWQKGPSRLPPLVPSGQLRLPTIALVEPYAPTEDWATPPYIIHLVHTVFNDSPDLDPASSVEHNQVVRAKRILTCENNGLAWEWHGSVFLNPPWGSASDTGPRFAEKLLDEHRKGHTTASISLWPDRCLCCLYWQPFWSSALICIPNHRIPFRGPTVNGDCIGGAPDRGHVIAYIGPDRERFAKVFQAVGHILLDVLPCGGNREDYRDFQRAWASGLREEPLA